MVNKKESFWSLAREKIGNIRRNRTALSKQTSRKGTLRKRTSRKHGGHRPKRRQHNGSKNIGYYANLYNRQCLYTKDRVELFQLRAAERRSRKLAWKTTCALEPIADVADEVEKRAEILGTVRVPSPVFHRYEGTGIRGIARRSDGVWEEKGKGVATEVNQRDSAYSNHERNTGQVDTTLPDIHEEDEWLGVLALIDHDRDDETDSNSAGPSGTTRDDDSSHLPATADENWPPVVIADGDIPQKVDLGLYRFAQTYPEQVPWWVFGDKHFHRLESERFERLLAEQKEHTEEHTAASKPKPTYSLRPESSVEPSKSPSVHARSSGQQTTLSRSIRFPSTVESPDRTTTTTTTTGHNEVDSSSTRRLTPPTQASPFTSPRKAPSPPITANSTTLCMRPRIESTTNVAEERYESFTNRRPSSLNRGKHSTAPPSTRHLPATPPPPASSISATIDLLERASQAARAKRFLSADTASIRHCRRPAGPLPPPLPPLPPAATTATPTSYAKASRVFFHREALDMLEGNIAAPEFSELEYWSWAMDSPLRKGFRDKDFEKWMAKHEKDFRKFQAEQRKERAKEKAAKKEAKRREAERKASEKKVDKSRWGFWGFF